MKEIVLQKLGIAGNEAKIYLILLRSGVSSAGDITKKSGIHRSNVYDALERLKEKGLINFVMKKTGFPYKNGIAACKHIKTENAKKKQVTDRHYLRIHWKSADKTIAICKDCAKATKNTLFNLTKYIIEPNISNDFSIDVIGQLVKGQESFYNKETQYIDEYLSGKSTDISLIRKNMQKREETIKQSGNVKNGL